MERVWESIHVECGHTVEHRVHVPGWDRWRWTCPCGARGVTLAEPTGPFGSCGDLELHHEEAILNLEVRSAEVPREYFDVTVRCPVPTHRQRLTMAADHDGALNKEAEREKRARYPDGRTPYRHGRAALLHLRKLARARAASLEEGGDAAVLALMQRWSARLSIALHQSNAALLRSSEKKAGSRELA